MSEKMPPDAENMPTDPMPLKDDAPVAANPPAEAAALAGADEDGQGADLLARTQAALVALQAKNQELNEQFLRAQADMQNTRRRAEEEVAKARKFALESFAESLLPVCDSLEAGLAHKDQSVETIREGAEATLRQLKSALERNRVVEINPTVGAKFDPHQHQAISVVPAEQEPNTVVSVLQKGYSIAERILRPALVTVTAPK
jgi:molecular chaperone GrpE